VSKCVHGAWQAPGVFCAGLAACSEWQGILAYPLLTTKNAKRANRLATGRRSFAFRKVKVGFLHQKFSSERRCNVKSAKGRLVQPCYARRRPGRVIVH
jgi:hypothetical protein